MVFKDRVQPIIWSGALANRSANSLGQAARDAAFRAFLECTS
jgi:hypothetical protein